MSKINTLGIDIGHCVPYDGGAYGIRREEDLNREVGSALIMKCRNAGIKMLLTVLLIAQRTFMIL